MYKKLALTLFFVFPFAVQSFGQKTEAIQKGNRLYKEGIELFSMEKYAASSAVFSEMIDHYGADEKRFDVADAYFYRGLCAIYLYNNDAAALMLDFIRRYPTNSKVHTASFQVGNFYVANKQYVEARKMYLQTDVTRLSGSDAAEYHYKLGYCYFQDSNFAKAKACFAQVKDQRKSKYAAPSNYYYAHILYSEGSYENALHLFLALRQDRNFRAIVPYYIAQIYYLQGNYDALLAMAPELSATSSEKRTVEINRMIGTAYSSKAQYSTSLPYWQKCVESVDAMPEDYYSAGFAYYKSSDYVQAASCFQRVNSESALGQNAWYHAGDCYIHTGDLVAAKHSFKTASDMDFDPAIKEHALFNYAKLAVDGKTTPYGECIKSFETFLTQYPQSKHAGEAKEHLAELYCTGKDYKHAVELLSAMPSRSSKLNVAYQRAALNYGIELFNSNQIEAAVEMFSRSLKVDRVPMMTISALYLRADAYYRMGNYAKCQSDLHTFYAYPAASQSIHYIKADYLMGYTQFMQRKYHVAADYFQRYLKGGIKEDLRLRTDAHNRLGDCHYANNNYAAAIVEYDLAREAKNIDQDYSLYQKAQCYGALGQYHQKIHTLESLLKGHSTSSHVANAKFQIAESHLVLNENAKALTYYQSVVKDYPQSSYCKEALSKIGLIYYKLEQDDKALEVLDQVVRNYPSTEEAKMALANIRNIYVNRNQADQYFSYAQKIPHGDISLNEKDSISYQAIENVYLDGRCPEAIKGFQHYLTTYPKGAFRLSANYFLGTCLMNAGDKSGALHAFEYVVAQPKSTYSEKALLSAADLSFALKAYDKAMTYYRRVATEAESNKSQFQGNLGIMRSALLAKQYDAVVGAAKQVLSAPKLSEILKEEAHYALAHALSHQTETAGETADTYYQLLKHAKNADYAGEAHYFFAHKHFVNGDLKAAEKIICDFSENPRDEYWLAKMLLLWGDIFAKRNNAMQAKQTYQSIVENYDGMDLKTEAQNRIDALNRQEEERKNNLETQAKQKANEPEVIVLGEGVKTQTENVPPVENSPIPHPNNE